MSVEEDQSPSTNNEAYANILERGSAALFSFIDKYCEYYAEKRICGQIDNAVYAYFFSIAYLYGFADQAEFWFNEKRDEKKLNRKFGKKFISELTVTRIFFGARPAARYFSALQEISEHQKIFGVLKWINTFFVSAERSKDINSDPYVRLWQILRMRNMRRCMARLRETILNEDWTAVGRIIGRLPALKIAGTGIPTSVQKKLEGLTRTLTIALGPFYATVFRTGVQRLMQHAVPPDIVAKSATELMLRLVEGDYKFDQGYRGYHARNLGMFYAVEILIFCIANSLYQEANDLVTGIGKLPPLARDPQLTLIFHGYAALLHYELWRKFGETAQNDALTIADNLIAAVNERLSGEEKVFVNALIHFSVSLGLGDMLFEALKGCCCKTPSLAAHCYNSLVSLGYSEIAEKLLSAVLDYSSELSPSDNAWLEWITTCLLNREICEIDEYLITRSCQILCNFLDYGENRSNVRAWGILCTCMRHVRNQSLLMQLWEERKSWWPKFQTVPIGATSEKCREEVLSRFSKLPEDY